MSKSYFSLLIFSLFLLFLVSCKTDAPVDDFAFIEVDFLVNNQDLDRYGLDYTEQELERDNNDPNKVLTVKVGEPVKFKDTSKGSSGSTTRKWQLNDGEWEEIKDNKNSDVQEFTTKFEDPGFYRITLVIGDFATATKLIKVVPGEYVASDLEVDETTDEVASTDIEVDEPEQDDLFGDAPKKNNDQLAEKAPERPRETPTRPKPTPTPPKPVVFSSVNFTTQSEVMVGQSFTLKDISAPSNAVTIRAWDLGDGSTQRTKGSTYNHMYFSSGEKTITLCLNNTSQCTSKRIMVKPRPKRKETAETTKPKTNPTPPVVPKTPEISSVDFAIPASAVVGTSVSLADRSQPSSAVMKRRWSFGDGTSDLNTGKGAISHIFNKPGKYTVKLCLNDSDKCIDKEITIEAKPAPEPVVAEDTGTSTGGGFDLSTYTGADQGRVGLLSNMKCDDQSATWLKGAAFVNISPKKPMELDVAKVYANKNGQVDIVLTNVDSKESAVIKNVQVNPGPTTIYLTDLALILTPDNKYTLMIKPSDQNSDLELENAVKCSPRPLKSDIVDVSYNDKFILYDLKFYY